MSHMQGLSLASAPRAILGSLLTIASISLAACSNSASEPTAQVPALNTNTVTTDNSSYLTRLPSEEIVYFVLPDRFENADPSNDTGGFPGGKLDHGFDPTHKGFYHGGDLKGLTARLDYIQGLGTTAIWLGPIFQNKPVQGGPGQESSGYHGYWITDFTNVDPHLGTRADMKAFVDAAHARGMKVYMDIITNHTADVINYRECHDPAYTGADKVTGPCIYRSVADYPYTTRGDTSGPAINTGFKSDRPEHETKANWEKLTRPDYAYTPFIPAGEEAVKTPAWLNDVQFYHNRGETTFEGESGLYGDFAGLDDLMTEHPVVVDGMIDIFKDWITEYRVDGFRIDTTRHVNPNFWKQFLPAMKTHAASLGIENFYMFGEVYNPDPAALARFTRVDGFDQVLDFGFQSAVFDVLSEQSGTDRFDRFFDADSLYAKGQETARDLPTFVGNHDMGRLSGMLKNVLGDVDPDTLLAKTNLGHAMMFFLRGVPVIYSGDEQGFVSDNNDQLAREDMFPSRVAVYNDNDLLGTDSTTAEANFDTAHPLYTSIAHMAKLRSAHSALSQGLYVPRLTEKNGGLLVVSRFDPKTGHEYLIGFNAANTSRTANVSVDAESRNFTSVHGTCSSSVSTTGTLSVTIPAYSYIICKSDQRAAITK